MGSFNRILSSAVRRGVAFALASAAVFAAWSMAKADQAADPVVARVNGIEIHERDVRAADQEMGRNLTMHPEGRREDVIRYLIDTLIFAGAADQASLDEADIRARVAFARNRAISEMVIAEAARRAVTEQAVRNAYDDMVAKIGKDPEYHLYALQFPYSDPNDEAAVKAAEDKARSAYQRIVHGESFESVTRDMAEDATSRANGGNRGYLTTAMMGREYAEVVPGLEKGKSSQPIKTKAGWHLIKIEDTRPRTTPSFETVRERIESHLAGQAQADFVSKLRSQAKIERLEAVSVGSRAGD